MSEYSRKSAASRLMAGVALASLGLTGCAGSGSGPQLPPASFVALQEGPGEEYVIGPLDDLTVFVWRNPELGAKVQVRPDGRITTPLITDMPAVGKTPSMLAQDIRRFLERPAASLASPSIPVAPPGPPIGEPALDYLRSLEPLCP